MEKEIMYESPKIEVIEVKIEKGFITSDPEGNAPIFGPGYEFGN